jgi:RNA binding exosome subunit
MERVRVVSLTFSALSHATEDKKKVLQAIYGLCCENTLSESKFGRARGYYGNEILTLRLSVDSPAKADKCFGKLWRGLGSSDRYLIQSHLTDFTDPSGTLFLRVDKEESYRGRVLLGGSETIKIEVRFRNDELPRGPSLIDIAKWMETAYD